MYLFGVLTLISYLLGVLTQGRIAILTEIAILFITI